MSLILSYKCCCDNTLVKVWSAAKCSTSAPCTYDCIGEIGTCAGGITFCDEYRDSIGLPKALDPDYCYFMVAGGCYYLVSGFTFEASCSSTPTLTHNIGSFDSVVLKDPLLGCEDLCPNLLDSIKYWGPEIWTGGFTCNSTLTVAFSLTGVYATGCSPFDSCSVSIGSFSSAWHIGTWPTFIREVTECQPDQFTCEECLYTGPQPDPGQLYSSISDQLGGSTNQCNPDSGVDDPCFTLSPTGPKATGFISLAANLYGASQDDLIYTVGFTITRSCAYTLGDGTGWVSFGDGMYVTIDNCVFAGIIGGTSEALATKINDVLGSSTDPGATTFVATGSSNAWIGQACVNLDFTSCPACLFDVTSWDGPTYSNGNKTATFYVAYKYKVGLQVSLSAFNYFGEADAGCYCTGSPFGQIFSAFISDPDSDPTFEKISVISGSDFTMIKDPGYSDDFPCVTVPTVT